MTAASLQLNLLPLNQCLRRQLRPERAVFLDLKKTDAERVHAYCRLARVIDQPGQLRSDRINSRSCREKGVELIPQEAQR